MLRIHDLQDCGKDKAYGRLDNYTIVQRRDGGHSVNANVTLDRTCVQSSAVRGSSGSPVVRPILPLRTM